MITRSLHMPYVQASPRVRAGYAAPLFSAFAFLLAAGVSLDGSPFCAPLSAGVDDDEERPIAYDPALAGSYKTWGLDIELRSDGSARVDLPAPREATWRSDARTIAVDWGQGSFGAAHEWWARIPAPPPPPKRATCEGGSC